MAVRKPSSVASLFRALLSFNDWKAGEERLEFSADVAALVGLGFLKVVDSGESETGPVATDKSDSGGGAPSDPAESAAGAEPGPDSGSGGHGAPEE